MAGEIIKNALLAVLFVIIVYIIFLFLAEGQKPFVYEGF